METKDHLITGKRILLTGGTTGIGRETALQLAALGADVLIVGTDAGHLNDTLNNFQADGNDGTLRTGI
jgi:NAD(P)-dependent dehydrogenase (short-subunit alcohol dehydrogenase family)